MVVHNPGMAGIKQKTRQSQIKEITQATDCTRNIVLVNVLYVVSFLFLVAVIELVRDAKLP